EIIDYNLKDKTPYSLSGLRKIEIQKTGTIHGIAGWFSAELADNAEINTSPFLPSTHWEQCFFSFKKPLKVKSGDVFEIGMVVKSDEKSNKVTFIWKLLKHGKKIDMGKAIV
ncbi:hypothetical protein K8Q98_00575, partial [Candidatus Nomurabacteria bacterium]|nr:hypothetical protein [Candidatus Nomurabacteria bacterium]